MYKSFSVILSLFVVFNVSFSQQNFFLEWQKSYGGSADDYGDRIVPAADGGFYVLTNTQSNNGDVSGNHGGWDIWVKKINATGTILWQKVIGGSFDEFGAGLQATNDGGCILTGTTYSNNGDFSGNHGYADVVLIKLNSAGNFEWKKLYGGTEDDYGSWVVPTSDGGYVVTGFSYSTNGNVTANYGFADVWVFKVNSTGTLVWQKTYGGPDEDNGNCILATSDGGFMVSAAIYSDGNDIIVSHGNRDLWLFKINGTGVLQWQKAIGGSGSDNGYQLVELSNGDILVAGNTNSTDGDVIGTNGGYDAWLVRVNNGGDLLWSKCYGGSASDGMAAIVPLDNGGFLFSGGSNSTDFDVFGNIGGNDVWVVKLNTSGGIVSSACFGGSGSDSPSHLAKTIDGKYILSATTTSNNGQVTVNQGQRDTWALKIGECAAPTNQVINSIACESYISPTGQEYSSSGNFTEVLVNQYGCDSIILAINLQIDQPYTNNFNVQLCSGQTYTWNGTSYSTAGSYIHNFNSVGGCDSTVTLHLSYFDSSTPTELTVQICVGDTYTWNDNVFQFSGTYTDVFTSQSGCDSTVVMTLSFYEGQADPSVTYAQICPGDTFTWNNQIYLTPSTYPLTLTSQHGCDSLTQLVLSYYSLPQPQISADVVAGQYPLTVTFTNETQDYASYNFEWNFGDGNSINSSAGQVIHTYNSVGVYDVTVTIQNPQGCSFESVFEDFIDAYEVGLSDNSLEALTIYPNPASDAVHFSIENTNLTSVTVFDQFGKAVGVKNINLENKTIDVSEFQSGIYFIQITSQNAVLQRKIQVIH